MRKLLVAAFFVVIFGIAFAYSGIGSKGESHNVPACNWSKINKGELPSECWDAKRSVLIMDGGRYEWDTRTNVLTDYAAQ